MSPRISSQGSGAGSLKKKKKQPTSPLVSRDILGTTAEIHTDDVVTTKIWVELMIG